MAVPQRLAVTVDADKVNARYLGKGFGKRRPAQDLSGRLYRAVIPVKIQVQDIILLVDPQKSRPLAQNRLIIRVIRRF